MNPSHEVPLIEGKCGEYHLHRNPCHGRDPHMTRTEDYLHHGKSPL